MIYVSVRLYAGGYDGLAASVKSCSGRSAEPYYLMAIGFTGDPTARVMGKGGAQKKNSYT